MVQISEWLPNPVGSDTQGEWVELFNDGATANLSGWYVQTGNGKKFLLHGTIGGGEFVVLPRSATKLTLRNSGETVSLFDGRGTLIDESRFLGEASEGKSVNRAVGVDGIIFARLGEPTPGAPNKFAEVASVIHTTYPFDTPVSGSLGMGMFLTVLLGCSALLTAFVLYAARNHKTLSFALFDRDEAAGRAFR